MILLDTHIWVWWVQKDDRLKSSAIAHLDALAPSEIGISAISSWEVATLHSLGRLSFSTSLEDWMGSALRSTEIVFHGLTPEIAIETANLPGQFHRDPADRIIVATARILDCQLVSEDEKILQYEHVKALRASQLR
jgi:PIN domain nuclease of toxin-antitoxin system